MKWRSVCGTVFFFFFQSNSHQSYSYFRERKQISNLRHSNPNQYKQVSRDDGINEQIPIYSRRCKHLLSAVCVLRYVQYAINATLIYSINFIYEHRLSFTSWKQILPAPATGPVTNKSMTWRCMRLKAEKIEAVINLFVFVFTSRLLVCTACVMMVESREIFEDFTLNHRKKQTNYKAIYFIIPFQWTFIC